ncbi:hypothetical protein ACIP93_31245 [Streptomyces sp. NPDC088745]|uniref:hypothetical protein n=1 Tax=Streptomyces sp. NPDC088745 TaxID=3365884 RepID=UPI00380A71ED
MSSGLVPSVETSAPRSGTPDFLSAFQPPPDSSAQGASGAGDAASTSGIPNARDEDGDSGAGAQHAEEQQAEEQHAEEGEGTSKAPAEGVAGSGGKGKAAKPAKKTAAKKAAPRRTEPSSTGAVTPPGAEYEALEKTTVYLAPTVVEQVDDARIDFIKGNRAWTRAHGKPSSGAWMTMLLSAGMKYLEMDLEAGLELLPPDGRRVRHQADEGE